MTRVDVSPARGRAGREAGFTLLEVVVVLAILAAVAGVVIPTLRAAADDGARDARRLRAVLETARDAAATRGVPVAVHIDAHRRTVAVVSEGSGIIADTLQVQALPPGARFLDAGEGRAVVRFDALGRSSGNVLVWTDGRERYAIHIDPWTGGLAVRR